MGTKVSILEKMQLFVEQKHFGCHRTDCLPSCTLLSETLFLDTTEQYTIELFNISTTCVMLSLGAHSTKNSYWFGIRSDDRDSMCSRFTLYSYIHLNTYHIYIYIYITSSINYDISTIIYYKYLYIPAR